MSWATQSIVASRDEQQRRAEVMKMCEVGQHGGHQIYNLGKAHTYWPLWAEASGEDKRAWRIIMSHPRDCGRGMRVCVCILGRVGLGY